MCVRVCARVSVCMCACVCVCEHSVPIFGPLYEIWVLVAHKSCFNDSIFQLERMCEGVGDSMFFFIYLSWFCGSWSVSTDMYVSLLMLSAGHNLPNTRRTITLCTCGNLSQFVYLLRLIEGMFYNYFLGFSAEIPDLEVLP